MSNRNASRASESTPILRFELTDSLCSNSFDKHEEKWIVQYTQQKVYTNGSSAILPKELAKPLGQRQALFWVRSATLVPPPRGQAETSPLGGSENSLAIAEAWSDSASSRSRCR